MVVEVVAVAGVLVLVLVVGTAVRKIASRRRIPLVPSALQDLPPLRARRSPR